MVKLSSKAYCYLQPKVSDIWKDMQVGGWVGRQGKRLTEIILFKIQNSIQKQYLTQSNIKNYIDKMILSAKNI